MFSDNTWWIEMFLPSSFYPALCLVKSCLNDVYLFSGFSFIKRSLSSPRLERVLERSIMVCLLGLLRTERLAREMSAVTRVMDILKNRVRIDVKPKKRAKKRSFDEFLFLPALKLMFQKVKKCFLHHVCNLGNNKKNHLRQSQAKCGYAAHFSCLPRSLSARVRRGWWVSWREPRRTGERAPSEPEERRREWIISSCLHSVWHRSELHASTPLRSDWH